MSDKKKKKAVEGIHPDFFEVQKWVYEPNGWLVGKISLEAESKEYGALDFEMNGYRIKFRAGKITPTKIGQFVTLWKRIEKGPICPLDSEDAFDFVVVSVRSAERLGQFVFPKEVLCEKGVVSKEEKSGKLAIRIYPPWDVAENSQAKKTQKWQLLYFFEIFSDIDRNRAEIGRLLV